MQYKNQKCFLNFFYQTILSKSKNGRVNYEIIFKLLLSGAVGETNESATNKLHIGRGFIYTGIWFKPTPGLGDLFLYLHKKQPEIYISVHRAQDVCNQI